MSLDPKLIYWTWAWINMVVIVAIAAAGVRRIRRGEILRHRRRMLTAAALVLLFLVSYVFKVILLGREPLETWSPGHVWVLRFHELCVAVMLVAGSTAVYLARRLGLATDAPRQENPAAQQRGRRLHRRAGWTAVVAATLGIASAGYVLRGMYERLGAP